MATALAPRAGARIILYGADADMRAWALRWDRDHPQLVDERVVLAIASAYCEGKRVVASRVATALGGDPVATWRFVDTLADTYTEIRNYLVGDHNVNPILAARVALRFARRQS